MDKTIRIFDSHREMKAQEYRYWQSRPAHERMDAVTELTIAAYKLKDPDFHVRPIEQTLVILDRTPHQPDGYAEPNLAADRFLADC